MVFAWSPIRNWFLNDARWLWVPLITVTLIDFMFRYFMAKVFYDTDRYAVMWKRRLSFNLFIMADSLASLPVSGLRAVLRLIYGMLYLALALLRVDFAMIPDDYWGSYDTPFASFAALVLDDESRSSPPFLAAASTFVPFIGVSGISVASQRVRNRFWLATTLHANPQLIGMRAHATAQLKSVTDLRKSESTSPLDIDQSSNSGLMRDPFLN